jgi:hypothetical protein
MKELPNNRTSGQAVLIILLVMAVILTIGLSVVSRSVTDINISQQSEDSARAFSAAEAGIEQALLLGTSGGVTFSSGAKVDISTREVAFGDGWYIYPTQVSVDQIITVWLSNYNISPSCVGENYCYVATGDSIRVYWGNLGTSNSNVNTPAIEVSIYYKDSATYKVSKYVLDPYTNRVVADSDRGYCFVGAGAGDARCTGVSSFTNTNGVDATISSATPPQPFQFAATLDLRTFGALSASRFPLFARLRLLYSSDKAHYLGVTLPGGTFPSQGKDVNALGTSGDASSKVHAFRPKSAPPGNFDFVLYSGTALHHEPNNN